MFSKTRRFVLLATTLITAGLLIGCGGSSNNNAVPSSTVSGTIQIPNSSVPALTIASGTETTPNSGTGFQLKILSSTYALITANDPTSGKTVLFGMHDPNASSVTLNPENCARTLIFLSLGGSQFSAESRKALWDTIAASPQAATLKTVIETEIATNLFALEDGNANIKASLQAAVNALGSSSSGSPLSQQNPITRNPQDPPPSFFISTSQTSPRRGQVIALAPGVAVDNLFSHAEGSFFAYNTGYADQEGNNHSTNPEQSGGETKFDAAGTSSTLPLTLDGDHSQDHYSIIVLQPIFDQAEPAIFANSDFSGELAKWRASLNPMLKRGFSAVTGASMLDAFGAPDSDFSSAALDETVTQLSSINSESGTIMSDVGEAQGLGSLVARMAGVAAHGDAEAFSALAAIAPLLRSNYPELAEKLATKSLTSAQIQGFRGAMRILSALGSWDYSSKAGRIAESLTTGQMAKEVKGSMGAVRIALTPGTSTFEAGKSLLLTAKPASTYTNPFTYTWSLESGPGSITNAVLNDNMGHVGSTITTTSPNVYLVTGNDSVGLAVVTVEGESTYEDNSPLYATATERYTPQGHIEFAPLSFSDAVEGPGWYGIVSGTFVMKPAPVNGVYAAGKLKITATVNGLDHTLDGSFVKEWNVPAFSGPLTPITKDHRWLNSTNQHLHPSSSTGSSSMGIAVFDYGDRFLIFNFSGGGKNDDPAYLTYITGKMREWSNAIQAKYTFK